MDSKEEQQIIERCQHGDEKAFRCVVQSYQRMVFSVSLRMVCNEDAAKDIVQETFIRVWLNIQKYERGKDFKTWIYTIAIRLCLDTLKKDSWEALDSEDETSFKNFVNEQSPDKHLENKELVSIIKVLARNLTPKQRMVFTLICLEHLETQEVERITGLSANKIKSNIYIARRKIKEQLKRLGYE